MNPTLNDLADRVERYCGENHDHQGHIVQLGTLLEAVVNELKAQNLRLEKLEAEVRPWRKTS